MDKRLAVALIAVALCGCGAKKVARTNRSPAPPVPRRASVPVPGDSETGVASWYGRPYHGRQAANGEVYDMETLVAAHRTLPFDTWVRVLNLANEQSVEVRIIDRGPFVDGRIIDLSHAAAQAIGLIGPGIARVRVEVTRAPPVRTPAAFAVQVGAYRDRENAERIRTRMEAEFGPSRMVLRPGDPEVWRVLVGAEPTMAGAQALASRIRTESGERTAFVLRLDTF
jgi:rare lipoprotein A